MAQDLSGLRVAVLATDGFEESELLRPSRALEDAGADVRVVSPKGGAIKGWRHTAWGDRVAVVGTRLQTTHALPPTTGGRFPSRRPRSIALSRYPIALWLFGK